VWAADDIIFGPRGWSNSDLVTKNAANWDTGKYWQMFQWLEGRRWVAVSSSSSSALASGRNHRHRPTLCLVIRTAIAQWRRQSIYCGYSKKKFKNVAFFLTIFVCRWMLSQWTNYQRYGSWRTEMGLVFISFLISVIVCLLCYNGDIWCEMNIVLRKAAVVDEMLSFNSGKSVTELHSVTCRMRSNSVNCHLIPVNVP